MAHTLDGYKIIVTGDTEDPYDPIYGLINIILGTTTIRHYAGEKSPVRRITGIMNFVEAGCGATDFEDLESGLGDSAVNYTAFDGSQGNYTVQNIRGERMFNINQTTPLYRVTIELLKA